MRQRHDAQLIVQLPYLAQSKERASGRVAPANARGAAQGGYATMHVTGRHHQRGGLQQACGGALWRFGNAFRLQRGRACSDSSKSGRTLIEECSDVESVPRAPAEARKRWSAVHS